VTRRVQDSQVVQVQRRPSERERALLAAQLLRQCVAHRLTVPLGEERDDLGPDQLRREEHAGSDGIGAFEAVRQNLVVHLLDNAVEPSE